MLGVKWMNLDNLMQHLYEQYPGDYERGKVFEKYIKWYLKNDKIYSSLFKEVYLWDEWSERWGRDKGIDIVCESIDSEIYAVQVKCYKPDYNVTKTDMDKFLSESSRKIINRRMLISTSYGLGQEAKETIEGQEKPVSTILHNELSISDWPEDIESPHNLKIEKKFPRKHQTIAINDCLQGFGKMDRGKLIMACGTGKTLVSLWLDEQMDNVKTLIFLPSLSLLSQTLREFCLNSSKDFKWKCVCSDDTIEEQDSIGFSVSEYGFPTDTNPTNIQQFLKEDGKLILFSTYQSSRKVAEALRGTDFSFDLLIADEAHRTAGVGTNSYSNVLNDSNIRAKKRLFMTATPRVFSARIKRKAEELEHEVTSMDDVEQFGENFHVLKFSDAVKNDLLTDYRVDIVVVLDEYIKQIIDNRTIIKTKENKTIDALSIAKYISVIKAIKKHNLSRVISFHSRKASAKEFIENLESIEELMEPDETISKDLFAEFISGETPSVKREVMLDNFRALKGYERGLLSNARCLSEGVDIPALDGVVFADSKKSQVDILQATGRVMRKSPDKELGHILIPLFIDPNEDPDEQLDESEFAKIWQVLLSLKDHDDEMSDYIDEMRFAVGKGSGVHRDKKVRIDVPSTLPDDFAEKLRLKMIMSASSSWEENLGKVVRFLEENPDISWYEIPQDYSVNDLNLSSWISSQRSAKNRGILSAHRIKLIEEKIKGWTWERREKIFHGVLNINKKLYDESYNDIKIFDSHTLNNDFDLMDDFKAYLAINKKVVIKKSDDYKLLNLERSEYLDILTERILSKGKSATLQQLGNKYGLTRERIRQQEVKIYELFEEIGIDNNKMRMSISEVKKESSRIENLEVLKKIYKDKENISNKTIKEYKSLPSESVDGRIQGIKNRIFNAYIIDKDKLKKDELLFVEQVVQDKGGIEKFYHFNAPVTFKEETYYELIKRYKEKHGKLPKTSIVRGGKHRKHFGPMSTLPHGQFLANHIQHIKHVGRISEKFKSLYEDLGVDFKTTRKEKEEAIFIENCDKLWSFIVTNNRYPQSTASSKEERYLAGFRGSKKQGFGLGVAKNQEARFMELENKIREHLGKPQILLKRRTFDEWFELLKEYVEKTGNNHVKSDVVVKDKDNKDANLGNWWHHSILSKYRKGELDKEQEKRLRDLGMDLDRKTR